MADVVEAIDSFARKPFGYDNPPVQKASDFLGVPGFYRTLDRVSYGEPLTTGAGWATKIRPDTVDALGFVPMAPKTAALGLLGGVDTGAAKAIFAGVNAKTADKAALATAEKMTAAGADPRAIWKETGWMKGGDGKWRFEIDDSKAMFNPSGVGSSKKENDILVGAPGVNFGPAIGLLEHPILENSYGKGLVQNSFVGNKNTMFGDGVQGAYDSAAGSITINAPAKAADARSTMLHELQHAVQQREGFAKGGSPGDRLEISSQTELEKINKELQKLARQEFKLGYRTPETQSKFLELKQKQIDLQIPPYEAYKRLAGEAEARAVQQRMNLTPDQRRATFPLDSYDVPIDQLIYR